MLSFSFLRILYLEFYPYFFLGYLFCLFFFGRSFAIINIPTQPVPIFVTEIFLFLSLPYFILNIKKIFEIPRLFLAPFLLFCGLGSIYLAGGLIQGNLFALRDIVLCVYPIFFVFLSFILFQTDSNKKRYLYLILISDLFLLIIGRLFLGLQGILGSGSLLPDFALKILNQQRSFNLSFYYGVIICFLLSVIFIKERKSLRLASSFLLALNIYMLIIMVCRSAWLAGGIVFIFFLVSCPRAISGSSTFLILVIVLVILLGILDSDLHAGRGGIIVKGKLLSFQKIINYSTDRHQSQKPGKKNIIYNQPTVNSEKQVVASVISPEKQTAASSVNIERQIAASAFNIKWRLSIWDQAIDFGRKSVLLGRGFGVYPAYTFPTGKEHPMQDIRKLDVDSGIIPAHNEIVTLFYKLGLLGLGLFLFFNMYVFFMGFRALQTIGLGSLKIIILTTLGCFLWWHIMALTSDMIDSPNMNIFLWVFLGILLNLINREKEMG
jgi:O-antigen ligase